jgi:hypothetical protein
VTASRAAAAQTPHILDFRKGVPQDQKGARNQQLDNTRCSSAAANLGTCLRELFGHTVVVFSGGDGPEEFVRFRTFAAFSPTRRSRILFLMRVTRNSIVAFVGLVSLTPAFVMASPLGVVTESGKTAGHAVRDSVQTVGRTVGAFFRHGPRTAKRAWKTNAARTKADAHADKAGIVREARDER